MSKVLEGYIENWNNVTWSGKGQSCEAGCFIPSDFIKITSPFNSVNYAFVLTSENWYSGYDPNDTCKQYNQCGADPFRPGFDKACPDDNATWPASGGAQALYWIPLCRTDSDLVSPVIDKTTTLVNPTPILFPIQDACRMAHQHPSGSKTFQISIGGWSDGSTFQAGYAKDLATLMVKLVLYTFADGVDLDFEHITQLKDSSSYRTQEQRNQQIQFIQELVNELRTQFDAVTSDQIQQNIQDFVKWIDQNRGKLTELQYVSHKTHLHSLCSIPPKFTISYTARFNAFLPDSALIGLSSFPTDGEGIDLSSNGLFLQQVDRYNLMCYDQPLPEGMDYVTFISNILNTTQKSIPQYFSKVVIGFQTGQQQGAFGTPGITDDEIHQILSGYSTSVGGIMFWGINETTPPHPLPSDIGDYKNVLDLGNKFGDQDFAKAGQDGYISGNPYNLPRCTTEQFALVTQQDDDKRYKNTRAWKNTFIGLTIVVILALVAYLIIIRPYKWIILTALGIGILAFGLPALLIRPASAAAVANKYTVDEQGTCLLVGECAVDKPCYDSLKECRDANPLYGCTGGVCQYDPSCEQPSDVCFLKCPSDCSPLYSCTPSGECTPNPNCKVGDQGCSTKCSDLNCSKVVQTYQCQDNQCVALDCDIGSDNCYTSDDCQNKCSPPLVHYECNNQQCVESDCTGGDGCYTTNNCDNKCSRFSCLDGECKASSCALGSDNCFTSLEDCVCPSPPKDGYSCVDGSCVLTHCQGSVNCFNDNTCGGTCVPKTPTYSCFQGDCIQTDCSGGNNCYTTNTCDNQCPSGIQMWSCDPSSHQCVQSQCEEGTNCYDSKDTCEQSCTVYYQCNGTDCIVSDCTGGPNCYKNDPTCQNHCANPKYTCVAGNCQADPLCSGGPNCYDTEADCEQHCSKTSLKWSCFGDTHECKQIDCVPPNCYNTQEACQTECGSAPPPTDYYYCQNQECKADTTDHCKSFPQDCSLSNTCDNKCTPFRCVNAFCTKDPAFCTDHPQTCFASGDCNSTCPTCDDDTWCQGKECGTAPCGKVCGTCATGTECDASGSCVQVKCPGICL